MFNDKAQTMTQSLPNWATELLQALEIEPVEVNLEALQKISAHLDNDPNQDRILTGFIAGYAAGLAQGSEMASFERAHQASVQFMQQYFTSNEFPR